MLAPSPLAAENANVVVVTALFFRPSLLDVQQKVECASMKLVGKESMPLVVTDYN